MKNKMKDFEKNIKKPSRLEKIEKLLYPKNIAVIGASNKFASVGNEIMQRLISFNFSGEIFPISLKEEKILNKKCYKSVLDVNKKIDLAVIAVPAPTVLKVIDECYQAKIESVVVISSGFKEIGEAGRELENKLLEKIKKYKMVMLGPNCLGVLNTHQKISMNASFSPDNPARVGKIGFASQSGALGSGIINTLTQTNLGLGQFVSLGNGADITALDLIEFWEKDDNINLIMLYMESLPNMKKFREVCTRVGAKKPIVVIKSGRSSVGARATASHTGSLAGDDVTTSSILASSGVIRELNLRDLVVTARALSLANLPKGENLAIITNAGGPGILASDSAEDEGIPLANLKDETKTKLQKILAPQASVNNPVDVIASASLEQITGATEILLKTEEVDIVLVIYLYITQQNDTALTLELEKLKEKYPNKSIVAMFMTTSDFSNRLEKTKENQVLTERI